MPVTGKRTLSWLLLITILTTTLASGFAAAPRLAAAAGFDDWIIEAWNDPIEIAYQVDPSASSWAVGEIAQAYEYGLTYPAIMSRFTQPITREEFCTIVVLLYEKLSGQTATAGPSPFSDTTNPEIIKAAQLGIVLGMGDGTFAPTKQITRQEITVMILRALRAAVPGLDDGTDGPFPFVDAGSIAPWAMEAMRFCYRNGIMQGVGEGRIDPLNNTTREQAIVLLKRTYEKYRDEVATEPPPGGGQAQLPPGAPDLIDGTVVLSQPPLVRPREIDKFAWQDWDNRLWAPAYDLRVELFAATEPGKPASLPVAMPGDGVTAAAPPLGESTELASLSSDGLALFVPIYPTDPIIDPIWLLPRPVGPVYTQAPYGAFIDSSGDRQRWFAFSLKTSAAAKVVWQVSKGPFDGFATDDWRTPTGLVRSGEVAATAREFVIDFATVAALDNTHNELALSLFPVIPFPGLTAAREIARAQRTYYVRAVAVDALGRALGDPGPGLPILYGKPLAPANQLTLNRTASFQLWAPSHQGMPTSGGEWPNQFVHLSTPRGHDPGHPGDTWIQPRAYDSETTTLVVQVATKPFTAAMAQWDEPAGLVYSQQYKRPVGILSYWPDAINVPFNSFGVPQTSLKADEFIKYYVRVVALRPANVAGAVDPTFSETVTVDYGFSSPTKWYKPVDVTVASYIPTVRIIEYEPVQWQSTNWAQYYEVFRAPAWNEIDCRWRNVRTDVVLYPFSYYLMQDASKTTTWYEQEMIPQVLRAGTKVRIAPPKEEEKGWWGQLWDGIVSFFQSLWDITKALTTWAIDSYNNFKATLIDWVASQLPIPGLKTALEWAANYGLMWLGLPPTLPNFDQLTNMSLDYLATVALTEAGMVPEEMTTQLMHELSVQIGGHMVAAANRRTPNPVDAPFLKADPDYLYRPAWIEVELSNPYNKPSRAGSLNIDIEWEWRDDVQLTYETWAHLPLDQQSANALQYHSHFLYGLKRGHSGYPVWYPVFEPVRGYPIPVLQPGQKVRVRIYLDEYIDKPYPFALLGDTVRGNDFANLYWGNVGPVKFSASTAGYDLPDPKTAALQQGHVPQPDHIYSYFYDRTKSTSAHTGLTRYVQKP